MQVYLDGVEQLSGWSVETTTGLVTFGTAPALGVEVTADFEFDVPVRFDTDHIAETYRLRLEADSAGRDQNVVGEAASEAMVSEIWGGGEDGAALNANRR